MYRRSVASSASPSVHQPSHAPPNRHHATPSRNRRRRHDSSRIPSQVPFRLQPASSSWVAVTILGRKSAQGNTPGRQTTGRETRVWTSVRKGIHFLNRKVHSEIKIGLHAVARPRRLRQASFGHIAPNSWPACRMARHMRQHPVGQPGTTKGDGSCRNGSTPRS